MEESLEGKPPMRRLVGVKRLVYWSGRFLQGLGLLLLWWTLLLFTAAADLETLLYSTVAVSVVVFSIGWACVSWAKSRNGR